MSIRYKIALWFSLLVMIILSLVSIAVYFFSVKERHELFNSRLNKRAMYTAGVYADLSDSSFAVLRKLDATSTSAFYDKSITVAKQPNAITEYMYADSTNDSLVIDGDLVDKARSESPYYFAFKNKSAVIIQHVDRKSSFLLRLPLSTGMATNTYRT